MSQPVLTIYDPDPAADSLRSDSSRKHRILIVDDEELLTMSLKEILVREGFSVSTALHALDAMKLLRETPFSLVMSDQKMPQMSGLEFLAQAKQLQPDATRILITGVVNLNTVIEAINTGEIFRFIVKPWIHEELLASVHNAVQRYDLICRNRELQRTTFLMNEQLAALNHSLEERVKVEARHSNELAEFNKALEENLQRSVEICLRTMQSFYPSLGVQADRVHNLCLSLADHLQLPSNQRQILEISAWLYDIGLVGCPRRLIKIWEKNPEALKPAEVDLIRQHPILGQELAGFIHNLNDVGMVIRSHHEHFDGSGYPDGKAGSDIPWLARILGVAIAFVSNPNTETFALEEIKRGSGTLFDPDAVRALSMCERHSNHKGNEREIPLSELQPGMVLAKSIYGSNGLLLMPEGQMLNEPYITKLKNHDRVNPLKQSLLVYC